MFFGKSRLRNIVIYDSELIIDYNLRTQKKIPMDQLNKVYISFEGIATSYKVFYLLMSTICIVFSGIYFYSFPIVFALIIFLAKLYEILHFYKTCTLNLELVNDKIAIRFIPFDLKFEVVDIINELKRRMNTPVEDVLPIEFSNYIRTENYAV